MVLELDEVGRQSSIGREAWTKLNDAMRFTLGMQIAEESDAIGQVPIAIQLGSTANRLPDKLNTEQSVWVHRVFVGAFDHGELERLVRGYLGVDLEEIVAHSGRNTEVHKLMTWAERNGRLQVLLLAAKEANPNNAELTTLVESLTG